MISRVLVPMDGSEMAAHALKFALEAYPDATITAFVVVGEPSGMFGEAASIAISDDPEEVIRGHAEPIIEEAREIADSFDRTVETDIETGHQTRAILNVADQYDTVVIGSHGGTLADRLFVGNVADKVLRQSPVPVTVVR